MGYFLQEQKQADGAARAGISASNILSQSGFTGSGHSDVLQQNHVLFVFIRVVCRRPSQDTLGGVEVYCTSARFR